LIIAFECKNLIKAVHRSIVAAMMKFSAVAHFEACAEKFQNEEMRFVLKRF